MKSVDELVSAIADRISLPLTDEDRWSKTAVIRAMNDCLQEQVIPKLIAEGSEYLVHRLVVPLTLNGQPAYPNLRIPLPRRTYGRGLREIKYIADDNSGSYPVYKEMNVAAVSVQEADQYESAGFSIVKPMVCLTNDYVRLLGNPQSVQGALVFYYYLEVSDIVDRTSQFATVSNMVYSVGTTTFTATAGTEYTTYQAVSAVKFVDIYRASTGAILRPNVKLTRTATSTFTTTDLTADDVTEFKTYQYGSMPVVTPYDSEIYLLPAGQSQFSTIPEPFDAVLVLETCSRILESLGDTQALEVVAQMLKKAYDSVSITMGNRLQGQQKRVTDQGNIGNLQRRTGLYRRYGFRAR